MANKTTSRLAPAHPLRRLARLVGTWDVEATKPGLEARLRGRMSIAWDPSYALVTMKTTGGKGGVPPSCAVIGADRSYRPFAVLYADEHGDARAYEMSLNDQEWHLQRLVKGDSKRFVGALRKGGREIHGTWSTLRGKKWCVDLTLVYRKR